MRLRSKPDRSFMVATHDVIIDFASTYGHSTDCGDPKRKGIVKSMAWLRSMGIVPPFDVHLKPSVKLSRRVVHTLHTTQSRNKTMTCHVSICYIFTVFVFMKGSIVVICSPGAAYARMLTAWMVNWYRQQPHDVALYFLQAGSSPAVLPLGEPNMWLAIAPVTENLIPGVLDKTLWFLSHVYREGWLFRTNLSSHVDMNMLCAEMERLPAGGALGFSPYKDHISGAGMGLSVGATNLLKSNKVMADRSLIDDVAISRVLFHLKIPVVWTGRLDRVYPDGLVCHGRPVLQQYHVRVKRLCRESDADILLKLATEGIEVAWDWFRLSGPSSCTAMPTHPTRLPVQLPG